MKQSLQFVLRHIMGIDRHTGKPCELSEAQKIIWNIFKEIKSFLDQEELPYFMLGGTLLGAVRHQGFIPWDDDIDIGLKRDDYEYFLEHIQASLPSHLQLHTYQNNPDHHFYFSQVVDTRFQMKRTGSIVERTENVWVDIFPIDSVPDHSFKRKIYMFRLLELRALYHVGNFEYINLRRPGRPLYERIVIELARRTRIWKRIDYRRELDKIDAFLKKYRDEDSEYIINAMGQYLFKEMYPREWYGSGKEYPFEDMLLHGPEDADSILKKMYGNYMEEPAGAEKNVHAAKMVMVSEGKKKPE